MNEFIDIFPEGGINLPLTLDCGQAFRWLKSGEYRFEENGEKFPIFDGVVFGKEIKAVSDSKKIRIFGSDESDRKKFEYYFDCGRNYSGVLKLISEDEILSGSLKYGTIRILNQEMWETLCTFIISSCNNIKRIRGIVERLCENFGGKINERYSFPTAEKIAELNIEDLDVIRAGFRSPYILNAAKKVASGDTDLGKIASMNTAEAENELMKLDGVGKKVADCVLLFGMNHKDAFPVDRHIMRFTAENYPEGLPEKYSGVEGIAQQYMFQAQRDKKQI